MNSVYTKCPEIISDQVMFVSASHPKNPGFESFQGHNHVPTLVGSLRVKDESDFKI